MGLWLKVGTSSLPDQNFLHLTNFPSDRIWSGVLNWILPTQMWFVGLDLCDH